MKNHLFYILITCLCFACDDIIEVEDISQNAVAVLAPTNDSILPEGNITFSWDVVQDAERYKLQIATPNFENAAQVLLDSSLTVNNFSKDLEIGEYEWRVKAENSEYQTTFTTQNFTVEE